ncbi:unnamed protein product, partial [Dracunculus medinensis]|uniref:Protein quiver n=1 Tax=Dracunculus medinensis TaxID=318479 RepID=A0A0N4UBG9_DRAME
STGISTVNSGCLNKTDKGVPIDACDEVKSSLPGSSTEFIERICTCSRDFCNFSSHKSFSSVLLLFISFNLFL